MSLGESGTSSSIRARLFGYLKPHRAWLIALVVLLPLTSLLALLGPQLVRRSIDGAIQGVPSQELLIIGTIYIAIAIARDVSSLGALGVSNHVAWSTTNQLRTDLVEHCLALDLPFYQRHGPGELLDRIDGDVSYLFNLLSRMALVAMIDILLIIGVLIGLFLSHWLIGVAFIPFVIFSLGLLRRLVGRAVPFIVDRRQARADLMTYVEERTMGAEDLKGNGAVPATMDGLVARLDAHKNLAKRAARVAVLWPTATQSLSSLGMIGALSLGSLLYLRGEISLGAVFLALAYASMLRSSLTALTAEFQDFEEAIASSRRIGSIFDQRSAIHSGSSLLEPSPHEVEFQSVSFRYELDDPLALHNISFTLEPAQHLGLVGHTGSGKSTMMRLLFRFSDPTEGSIKFGGKDLKDLDLASLRQSIALVTQRVQVFNASVRANLTFFNESISDDRLVETMGLLGLNLWLESLPQGLDTHLGSGGHGLSGGEAQLLAFARAFLSDPQLVLLDEPSALLDPATERSLRSAVDELLEGRTALVIAHRLETIQRLDRIAVLRNGKLVEWGSPDDLLESGSEFARLIEAGEVV